MSGADDSLWVRAPAKVNLYLEVLGTRDDGYHEIRSLLVPVSLCDNIHLAKTGGGIECEVAPSSTLREDMLAMMEDGENLASRAARLLKKETSHPGGAKLILEKHIPVGGGLGGGSADAAAVLVGLNTLWGTGLCTQDLMELGAKLGCDVPAMVHGGPVLVEGLGERVRPALPGGAGLPGPGRRLHGDNGHVPWWMVIANPGFPVSTRDIYGRYSPSLTSGDRNITNMVSALEARDVTAGAEALHNSLEGTVLKKYPLIGIVAAGIRDAGALGALVSGSGASVFGLARGKEDAVRLNDALQRSADFPLWSCVAKSLPDGVMVAHGPLEA